uniref:Uncharacterized protein n=1 Tax=Phaeomonas parva TaxID=124430 RepID=A0A7S1UC07_9STRA|mmetsp:Transcript_40827/g.127878  ORF Transcript_40827/g.127878 Transcript_40827/m.127878 type:complete len:232 (+) Transcript_40827:93-788(+)
MYTEEGKVGNEEEPQAEAESGLRSMKTSFVPTLMLRCKVVIVGDACVGKTAIASMFESNLQQYPRKYNMTTTVEFTVKLVPVRAEGVNVAAELYLFDCAGQSIFNQVGTNSKNFENASYVIIVYDVANRESFQSCGRWLQQIRSTRPSSGPPIPGVLLANKIDLRSDMLSSRAEVTESEGRGFAAENGLAYFECSALQGAGINEPFHHIANTFYERYEQTLRRAEQMTAGM